MIMAFVVVLNNWRARCHPTPQERVSRYVSLMPISVLAAAPGAQSSGGVNDRH
jgi:hypothetical protein